MRAALPLLEPLMPNPSPCLYGCDYPAGECSGACLAYESPHVRPHGLPIDIVEPCPARAEGDRVPCHLSMPDVAWPAAMPPVLRPDSRRGGWRFKPDGLPVEMDSTDVLDPAGIEAAAWCVLVLWLALLSSVLIVGLEGWLP